MRVPNLIHADSIKNNNVKCEINGKWYVAKPLGFYGLMIKERLNLSWKVFTGKYDVLIYQEDMETSNA